MKRASRRLLLLIILIVTALSFLCARRPEPPKKVRASDYYFFGHFSAQPGRLYQILQSTRDSSGFQNAFLLYDPEGDSLATLVCPIAACDTETGMRSMTLVFGPGSRTLPDGFTITTNRVWLNPYPPNQLTPMPHHHRRRNEYWPPPDSLRYRS